MTQTQTAVQVKTPNNELHVDVVKDAPILTPSSGQVLVKVHLRPVNPADIASIRGLYAGFRPKTYPAVPGLEGVGTVVKNGPGASKLKEGARVVSVPWPTIGGAGTWQQYVCVPEEHLIPIPDKLSDTMAAQFLVNPVAAYGFLEVLQVPEGAWLLQTAAGSTLGPMLIAMAKLRGVRTINVVRRKAQSKDLLDNGMPLCDNQKAAGAGADAVIATDEVEDVPAKVKEITGGELAYGAVDAVAGSMTGTVAASVREGGLVLVYGALSGSRTIELGVADVLFRQVRIHGFWLNKYLESLGDKAPEVLSTLVDLLAKGGIAPSSGKKYPLEQANEAIKASQEAGRSQGKIFLEG